MAEFLTPLSVLVAGWLISRAIREYQPQLIFNQPPEEEEEEEEKEPSPMGQFFGFRSHESGVTCHAEEDE